MSRKGSEEWLRKGSEKEWCPTHHEEEHHQQLAPLLALLVWVHAVHRIGGMAELEGSPDKKLSDMSAAAQAKSSVFGRTAAEARGKAGSLYLSLQRASKGIRLWQDCSGSARKGKPGRCESGPG